MREEPDCLTCLFLRQEDWWCTLHLTKENEGNNCEEYISEKVKEV